MHWQYQKARKAVEEAEMAKKNMGAQIEVIVPEGVGGGCYAKVLLLGKLHRFKVPRRAKPGDRIMIDTGPSMKL